MINFVNLKTTCTKFYIENLIALVKRRKKTVVFEMIQSTNLSLLIFFSVNKIFLVQLQYFKMFF